MKIRELLTEESRWTKFAEARTARQDATMATSPTAVCWCLIGAVAKCYPHRVVEVELALMREVREDRGIDHWNDAEGRTFAEVKALVDRLDV